MSQEVIDILQSVGAVLVNDHFVGTSGRHIGTYVNKDALYPHTDKTSRIAEIFADTFKNYEIDTVVGPAMGGIILSQWVAHHLSKKLGHEVCGVYAEKVDGELKLTRGYDAYVKGKNVLVVEDLTTTGGSLKKVVDLVEAAGGKIIAASVMLNKDPELVTDQTFSVPFVALSELNVPSYDEKECPLCQKGIPVNTVVGHGKKFLQQKNATVLA